MKRNETTQASAESNEQTLEVNAPFRSLEDLEVLLKQQDPDFEPAQATSLKIISDKAVVTYKKMPPRIHRIVGYGGAEPSSPAKHKP